MPIMRNGVCACPQCLEPQRLGQKTGLSEVVRDNKIQVLLDELFRGVFNEVLSFRSKTDENRSSR